MQPTQVYSKQVACEGLLPWVSNWARRWQRHPLLFNWSRRKAVSSACPVGFIYTLIDAAVVANV